MKKEYLISIITPTYNSEKTIERTIISVLQQTYPNIEYIIKDGGSTDSTLEIIEKYRTKFLNSSKSLKIKSEQDHGIGDAFNKGISLSTGDYVGIINSDDWYEPDAVQNIVDNIEEKYLVYCGDLKLWDKGSFIKKRKSKIFLLPLGMYIMHPTVFVKRNIYSSIHFNTSLEIAIDFDLMLNINSKYKNSLKYIPIVIANMELGGVSSNKREMRIEEAKVMKTYHSKMLYFVTQIIKKIEGFVFS